MRTSRTILVARGHLIRRMRGERSQRELAQLLGIHRPAFSAIEAGTRDLTVCEAVILANALDVRLPDLALGRLDGGVITNG